MKKFLLLALCLPVLAIATGVQAESRGGPDGRPNEAQMHMRGGSDMHASTTSMQRPQKGEKPELRKAIPGVVTSVSATGFTMTGRGQGKNHATTTLTVVVTPTTVFQIRNSMTRVGMPVPMGGSNQPAGSSTQPVGSTTQPIMTTTASLTDIVVGSKVEVFGKVATSTNSITADRVHINRGKGEGDMKEHMRGNMASGTPNEQGEDNKGGFFKKLKNFFGGCSASNASGTPSGGPAAAGFMESLGNFLLSWFH